MRGSVPPTPTHDPWPSLPCAFHEQRWLTVYMGHLPPGCVPHPSCAMIPLHPTCTTQARKAV